mmetsp:Transcript_16781/g.48196  ORF Transcript_16781/g.48196 Transcript_16781/m.48196 type:complete len:267 (+) Transcript_16781:59-859(+)
MHRLLSMLFLAICLIAVCSVPVAAQTEDSPVPVPCAPLADYVDPKYQENLEIFMLGGDVSPDLPVFFKVPRTEISRPNPQVKLCIQDLPIPTSVGEVPCDDWNRCWLNIGRHTGSNLNPDDVQYCKSSDAYRGTAPCYACTCSGSNFGMGSAPPDRSLTDGCGLSSQKFWGTGCDDVMNARYNADASDYSNYSTVQINICGGIEDNCNICRGGGFQPGFRVGLQWSNRMEQCFENYPFASSGSVPTLRHVLTFSAVAAIVSMLFFN